MPGFTEILKGYKRFRENGYNVQKDRYDHLAQEGQTPPMMVISCCDSRVDPATIFDAGPGEIFALRNVANLVPPYETGGGLHGASAAIEFGVTGLEVKHIIVMGHGKCGGIAAALTGGDMGVSGQSFIDDWMEIVKEARDEVVAKAPVDPQRALEMESVKVSLSNLRSFPFIKEREDAGTLKLHGTWFAISEGKLHVLDEDSGEFSPA